MKIKFRDAPLARPKTTTQEHENARELLRKLAIRLTAYHVTHFENKLDQGGACIIVFDDGLSITITMMRRRG